MQAILKAIGIIFVILFAIAWSGWFIGDAHAQFRTPSFPSNDGSLERGMKDLSKALKRRGNRKACKKLDDIFESRKCARYLDSLGPYEREAFIRRLPK